MRYLVTRHSPKVSNPTFQPLKHQSLSSAVPVAKALLKHHKESTIEILETDLILVTLNDDGGITFNDIGAEKFLGDMRAKLPDMLRRTNDVILRGALREAMDTIEESLHGEMKMVRALFT